jgi:hypothetical protein
VKKCETLVDVFDLVDSHLSGVRLSKFFAGNDLEKPHQVLPVRQIDEQIVDLQKLGFEMN